MSSEAQHVQALAAEHDLALVELSPELTVWAPSTHVCDLYVLLSLARLTSMHRRPEHCITKFSGNWRMAQYAALKRVFFWPVDDLHSQIIPKACFGPEPLVVIDVGANIGLFSLWFLEQSTADCRLICIEPAPHSCAALMLNLRCACLAT
jgi:hypothetical protein